MDAAFDILWQRWDAGEPLSPDDARVLRRAARLATKGEAALLRGPLGRTDRQSVTLRRKGHFDERKHPDLWTQPEIDAFVAYMRQGGPDYASFSWETWLSFWGQR